MKHTKKIYCNIVLTELRSLCPKGIKTEEFKKYEKFILLSRKDSAINGGLGNVFTK